MLQSAPGVLFTLVAGPLTDSWGRRPLILSALLGYLLLNLILLVNAVWFLELKVFLHHTSHIGRSFMTFMTRQNTCCWSVCRI